MRMADILRSIRPHSLPRERHAFVARTRPRARKSLPRSRKLHTRRRSSFASPATLAARLRSSRELHQSVCSKIWLWEEMPRLISANQDLDVDEVKLNMS